MTSTNIYAFSTRTDEERRLQAQSASFDPLTQRLFNEVGLAPGMRVLDLGCGVGNVSRLAAAMVGPDGSVLGVDRDPLAIERSQRLTAAEHVSFQQADVNELATQVGGEFDAVVGRLVLPYVVDAAAVLRQAASLLRPGGLLCVQEPDLTYDWVSTPTPLWDETKSWFLETLTRLGADPRAGTTLFESFRAAGLPDPQLVLEAPVGGGAWSQAYGWAAGAVAAWPLAQQLAVLPTGTDPDHLQDRLEAEIAERGGSVVGPPMFGAWARIPQG
ncbi:class I SAM-dependent methyltransferase [Ornithinimicrobium faecis]|uniref:class I SAM-dependent methyltransferase n=1 Tax=Ornithinimicrobium faecis TaxID=2934158 RepID=UPI00211959D8|nr:class I SAM-dependent methyltransferase [Ornithinimicrobium sp. HY1745]